jgi:hypothetical protein
MPPMGNEPWTPGSRLRRLSDGHSYLVVLVLIVATFVLLTIAGDERWWLSALMIVESAMLAAAIWASGLGRVKPAVVLVAMGVAVALILALTSGKVVPGIVQLVAVTLVAATIAVIALGVIDQREVNRRSITGAICVYLLIGITFTFFYGALAALGSGDFFAQGTDGTSATRVYFSYVTMATVGYGDYTAAGRFGRSLAVSEALLGQLYLVTVLALLVGRVSLRDRI